MKNNDCYISGKISGLKHNIICGNFMEAEYEVSRMGMFPVSTYGLFSSHWRWFWCMLFDIIILMTCRYVYFQKNWRKSKGARIEHFVSKITFKKIFYE